MSGSYLRGTTPDAMFAGVAKLSASETNAGLLWGLGDNRRKLGVLAGTVNDQQFVETGYYELGILLMNLVKKDDAKTASFIRRKICHSTTSRYAR